MTYRQLRLNGFQDTLQCFVLRQAEIVVKREIQNDLAVYRLDLAYLNIAVFVDDLGDIKQLHFFRLAVVAYIGGGGITGTTAVCS